VRVRRGLLLSLFLTGCGGEGEVLEAGDVTVLVSAETDQGMAAEGGGTLEVVGGCLGTDGYVVVWPHGTEVVDEDPLTIDVPGAGRVALGDDVSLGGGFVLEHTSTDHDGPLETGDVTVPAACAEHDVFLAHDLG
jgi:hypothetical protein